MEQFTEVPGRIENYIEEMCRKKGRVIIAIDGRSGSGKTTLAQNLEEKYKASVYHMDDFFLQPAQRTTERLAEIGGNVDYERFHQEILVPLLAGREFSYGVFNCKQQRITEYRQAGRASVHIVEGSYSQHPYFGSPYDLKICLDIGEELQRERIRKRNGEEMLRRFVEEWIPKENAYLEKFHIMEQADIMMKL